MGTGLTRKVSAGGTPSAPMSGNGRVEKTTSVGGGMAGAREAYNRAAGLQRERDAAGTSPSSGAPSAVSGPRMGAGKVTGMQQANRAGGKVGRLNQRIENRMTAGKDVFGLQEHRAGVMGKVQGRMTKLASAGRPAGGRAFSRGLAGRGQGR